MSADRPGESRASRAALVAAAVWLVGVAAANYVTNPAYHWYAWQLRELILHLGRIHGTASLLAAVSTVFGLGFGGVRRLGESDPLLALATAMSVGLATLGLAAYTLCVAGVMGPVAVGLVLAAMLLVGAAAGGRIAWSLVRAVVAGGLPERGQGRWIAVVLLCFIGATALGSLAPARTPDDAAGHIPFALWIAQGGHPWRGHQFSVGFYPSVPHSIYASGMALSGLPGGRGINLLFLAASLVFIERLGRDLFGRPETGRLAALLWATTIPVGLYSIKTYLDVPYASFALGAALMVLRWARTGAPADAGLAILFGAFSASAKSHGLVVFLLVAIWIAAIWRPRHATPGRALLAYGLLALAWVLPWYVRNALVMDDPFYPFTRQTTAFSPGVDPTARSLVTAPFLVAFFEGVFILPASGGVHLALVPFGLAVHRSRRVAAVLATAIVFSAIWFLTYQNVRYLLPALGLFSVLSGAGLDWFLSSGVPARWAGLATIALGVGVTAGVLLGGNYHWDHRGLLQTAAVSFGLEKREEYLARNYGPYLAVEYANGLGEECTGLLLEHGVEPIVYLEVPYVVVHHLAFRDPVCTEEEYPAFLVEHRISHVLVDENREPGHDFIDHIPDWRRRSWGEVLFERNGFKVYRLRPPGS